MQRRSPNWALGSTYLIALAIAALVYMVRERTFEFFFFDELAALAICILVWREAHKWSDLVEKMIWKPQPCTAENNPLGTAENNPLDVSIPNPQLILEETDSDFEVIEEECHTHCCSNEPQETLEALMKGFIFNIKGEGDTAAEGNQTLDADDCTSEVKSRVFAFYMRVAEYLAKAYSIASPGNRTPEACTENVFQLLLLALIKRDNSTLHVKLDDPFSRDPTNGVTITSTNEYALNENERTEALAFANRVFAFISHKLARDGKVFKEAVNPSQEYECKRMYKFVAHMLSTFDDNASKEVDFEVDTGLLNKRLVKHLIEIFAVVKPGDTTPETKYKIIKRLLYKTLFNDKEPAKSKYLVGHSNTQSRENSTGAEDTSVSVLKRMFNNLFINVGLKSPEDGEATVAETVESKHVENSSTLESGDNTMGGENPTLTAHEEDEVVSLLERGFKYMSILSDLIDEQVTAENEDSSPAETEDSSPAEPVTCIHKFIFDMMHAYFLK